MNGLKDLKILLGERLKAVRLARGLQMTDIENQYPISRQAIARLEKGDGTLNSLMIYMHALDVTEQFFEGFFKYYKSPEQMRQVLKDFKKSK